MKPWIEPTDDPLTILRKRISPEVSAVLAVKNDRTGRTEFTLRLTDGRQIDLGHGGQVLSYRTARGRVLEAAGILLDENAELDWERVAVAVVQAAGV